MPVMIRSTTKHYGENHLQVEARIFILVHRCLILLTDLANLPLQISEPPWETISSPEATIGNRPLLS